jgi:transposase
MARTNPVSEIARRAGILTVWPTEFLARFDHPDVSNGPTDNLNLKIKNPKRVARGDRSFHNYRLPLRGAERAAPRGAGR